MFDHAEQGSVAADECDETLAEGEFEEETTPDGHPLEPNYDLRICSTCKGLYVGSREVSSAWRCKCRGGSLEARRQWYLERYGYRPDIVGTWSLCCLCAQDLTRSDSRWSWLVCPACHRAVDEFHLSVGARLIPIGRHSVMNGAGLPGDHIVDSDAVRRFTKATSSLSIKWTLMFDWERIALTRNLDAAGARPGLNLTLRQLRWRLRRLAKSDPRVDQDNALGQFLEWVGFEPTC